MSRKCIFCHGLFNWDSKICKKCCSFVQDQRGLDYCDHCLAVRVHVISVRGYVVCDDCVDEGKVKRKI